MKETDWEHKDNGKADFKMSSLDEMKCACFSTSSIKHTVFSEIFSCSINNHAHSRNMKKS